MDRELRLSMSGRSTALSRGLPDCVADLAHDAEELAWAGVAKSSRSASGTETPETTDKETFCFSLPAPGAPPPGLRAAVRKLVSHGMLPVKNILSDPLLLDALHTEVNRQEQALFDGIGSSDETNRSSSMISSDGGPPRGDMYNDLPYEPPCGDIHDGSYSTTASNTPTAVPRRLDLKLLLSGPIRAALDQILQTLAPVLLLWSDGGLLSPVPLRPVVLHLQSHSSKIPAISGRSGKVGGGDLRGGTSGTAY